MMFTPRCTSLPAAPATSRNQRLNSGFGAGPMGMGRLAGAQRTRRAITRRRGCAVATPRCTSFVAAAPAAEGSLGRVQVWRSVRCTPCQTQLLLLLLLLLMVWHLGRLPDLCLSSCAGLHDMPSCRCIRRAHLLRPQSPRWMPRHRRATIAAAPPEPVSLARIGCRQRGAPSTAQHSAATGRATCVVCSSAGEARTASVVWLPG